MHKYNNGNFEKVKCRLLLLGNELLKYYDQIPEESNACTIALTSLFIVLGLAAKFRLKRAQIDFKGAFLYATLKDKDTVYAVLNKDQTNIYILEHPEYSEFRLKNGTMIVHVIKALYGESKSMVG